MTKHLFLALLTICFTIISTNVRAQATNTMAYPDYIQSLADAGAQVRFLGNDLGLSGWMTVKDGRKQFVYATPNQEAYVVGVLLDRTGKLVTAEQIDRYIKANPAYLQQQIQQYQPPKAIPAPSPAPVPTTQATPTLAPVKTATATTALMAAVDPISIQPVKVDPNSPPERLLKILKAGNWVEFGKPTAPLVYAFIDPECSHCHQFITDLREKKSYETGDIRTRLLPVGIMGKESLYEAAKLIDDLHPQKAFFDHLDGDEFALPVDEKYNIQKVQGNMAIMQDWELDVTPFVIYRNKMGQVKIIRGRPKDVDALLADIK